MTERIKSAIETFKDYKENGYDIRSSNGELFDTAIRSLQAWEEVIGELEEEQRYLGNTLFQRQTYEKVIDIINKHLAEINK